MVQSITHWEELEDGREEVNGPGEGRGGSQVSWDSGHRPSNLISKASSMANSWMATALHVPLNTAFFLRCLFVEASAVEVAMVSEGSGWGVVWEGLSYLC